MGSVPAYEPSFSAAPEVHSFNGLLFDFDGISLLAKVPPSMLIFMTGTIIDSTDAIVKHWHK
jgi:glycerol-1-phosphatase